MIRVRLAALIEQRFATEAQDRFIRIRARRARFSISSGDPADR